MNRGYEASVRIHRPTMGRFLATFGFAWLMIGLFTGTVVLVVLVRWLVNLLNHWGLGQTAENRALIAVILAFIVGSFLLTRSIVRRVFRMESPRWRRVTVVSLLLPGVFSLWAWSNPTRLLAGLAGTQSSTLALANGPEFIFGSYPDDDRIRALKRQGVTTIVSLQHPAVLVELQGIKAERETVAREGLQFIQAPMLPWVSDNTDALAKIRDIVLHGHGKYYVHCGLGRDRVNIVKRVVEALADSSHARVASASGVLKALGFEARGNTPFERGRIFQLGPEAWLIPFPNAAEMYAYVLQGRAGHVYFLLDPADTLQQRWLAGAEKDLKQYVVPYTVVPFGPADTLQAPRVVSTIRAQQPPVTIVVPTTTWGDPATSISSYTAEAVLKAYGKLPASARPTFALPDSTLHEWTREMLLAKAAGRPSPSGARANRKRMAARHSSRTHFKGMR